MDIPGKGSKDDGSNTAVVEGALPANPPVATPARSYSDESRKPEDHGDELNAGNSELVGRGREAHGRKNEICNGKQGPDGGEEHKGNARWRPGDIGVDHCRAVSRAWARHGSWATYGMH